ncbi:MAG: large-conductance mechanosensitive channel protein MscL [Saprospiraceae bacterium]|jgi:large conductance mechanosensitive channel|nr:large-conductance mechanosensitive channel protein MscL [Saprospiraceae bacterium]MDP4819491.1 large-conductance mechanosensitive channel protein MscL [Saprospiraceae bacterium]MDP4998826.1 large-conductance mechanosensitive channel protein MscL [Saprospiraceae bacterium]
MLKEFKSFLMRGNVLDLAIAVIIGAAFGSIVSSFTNDIIMPVLGLLTSNIDFTQLVLVLKEATPDGQGAVEIRYGKFIQTIVDFLIIGFVIFMLLRSYRKIEEKLKKEEQAAQQAPPAPGPSAESLLTEIRDLLKNK